MTFQMTFAELKIGAEFFDTLSGDHFVKISEIAGMRLNEYGDAWEGEEDGFEPTDTVEPCWSL